MKQMINNRAKRSNGTLELFTLVKGLHVRHETLLAVMFKGLTRWPLFFLLNRTFVRLEKIQFSQKGQNRNFG